MASQGVQQRGYCLKVDVLRQRQFRLTLAYMDFGTCFSPFRFLQSDELRLQCLGCRCTDLPQPVVIGFLRYPSLLRPLSWHSRMISIHLCSRYSFRTVNTSAIDTPPLHDFSKNSSSVFRVYGVFSHISACFGSRGVIERLPYVYLVYLFSLI